jgi:hypothetical protein
MNAKRFLLYFSGVHILDVVASRTTERAASPAALGQMQDKLFAPLSGKHSIYMPSLFGLTPSVESAFCAALSTAKVTCA